MNSLVVGRPVSAEDIRQLWSAIKFCQSQNLASTRATLVNHLVQNSIWRADEADVKLQHCLDCEVVQEKINPNLCQDVVICPPEEAPQPRPDHDWYCFGCHGDGNVLKCQNCFRVYHPNCLSATGITEKPKGFTCLPCLNLNKIQKLHMEGAGPDLATVRNKIDNLVTWIESIASSVFDTLPDDTVDLSEEQAQWIIYEHMDLNTIRNRNRNVYLNVRQFAIDFELLVHDAILLFGRDSKQGDLITNIWQDVKKEVDSIQSGHVGPISSRTDYMHDGRRMDDGYEESGKKRRKTGELALDQAGDMIRSSLPKEVNISRPPAFLTSADSANMLSAPPGQCGCDLKYKQLVLDLQQHWLNEFKLDREKAMVELSERLQRDFTLESEKSRSDMMNQFKQELDATKKDLDARYTVQLKQEIQKLNEKHKKSASEVKKKQWCWQCESEAIYHCCWNTAYCSVECQQSHWTAHRKYCRRKKQQN